MSRLREQLQSAKTAYTSVRYPGDVASIVLPTPYLPYRRRVWITRASIVGSSLAAALTWIMILSHPGNKQSPKHGPGPVEDYPQANTTGPAGMAGVALAPPGMPEMTAMPDLWAMPAMPAIPAGIGSATPPDNLPGDPLNVPEMMPLAPPGGLFGFPPATALPASRSTKEPA